VRYRTVNLYIESMTFKLLVGAFRDRAAFSDTLVSDSAQIVFDARQADTDVTLTQPVRGGVQLRAKRSIVRTTEDRLSPADIWRDARDDRVPKMERA